MATDQMSIFDVPQAIRNRDHALTAVANATDPAWRRAALWAVIHTAAEWRQFTTDDVWQTLHDAAIPAPEEGRALGPIMRQAVALGVVTPTDRVISSSRPACNRRPVRVWHSEVFTW